MLSRISGVGLVALLVLFLSVPAQAATFNFTFENGTGIRATSAGILRGGEVSGFSPMGHGTQTFQVILPDGQCRATLRIRFNDSNGRFVSNYYDVANHNFCTGPNGLRLVAD